MQGLSLPRAEAEIAATKVYMRQELWFNGRMHKSDAIELLGGTVAAVANSIGTTYQAVSKWPDVLPPRIADRVQAALYRRTLAEAAHAAPEPDEAAAQ